MPDYAGRPSKRREKVKEAEEARIEEQKEPKTKKKRNIRVMGVPILIVVAALLHIVSALNVIFFFTILLGILTPLLVLIYLWMAYNVFTMRPTVWMMVLILNGGMALFNLFYFVVLGVAVNLVTIIIIVLPSVRSEFGR